VYREVITVTTADLRWTPTHSSVTLDGAIEDEIYVGRHRKAGARSLSVMRMMYRPRHRRR
jgi:hypothetical protein